MPKSSKSRPNIATRSKSEFGSVTSELEVPIASDVVYRHIWLLKKFQKILLKNETIDSSILKCILNGTKTYWNISIRFWKGIISIEIIINDNDRIFVSSKWKNRKKSVSGLSQFAKMCSGDTGTGENQVPIWNLG